ncbi:hypothetical protein BpHYR1_023546 [Brachionus plicatilis]|uniref:Uncharacterized protein n=1 Tax=Brachionus plicatilis TaxID=10195 RepID=A0A3M7RT13_BRAPC|nr:hypothetical protein BpHYR1_023546 [Brachionus plicatilis]
MSQLFREIKRKFSNWVHSHTFDRDLLYSTFLNKVDSFLSTAQAALEHRLSTCSRVLKQL